ncbi:carboxypeptidase B-like protein, partial [Leptotrombidium deliense]
ILDNEKREIATRRSAMRSNKKFFRNTDIFQSFPRLEEINTFLSSLVAKNPKIASLESIGQSFENRDMKIIKIRSSADKPIIWIDAGIHAREWAAPITSLYIANELVSNYNTDPSIKKLVDSFEWQILPSANPDGYEYSHRRDRLWRKTRSNRGGRCIGVDPNRNWGFHWNEVGASSNPCDDTYAGPSAFSEIETRNIRDYILKQQKRMKAYLSIHAYSQLWLTPWGYTSKVPSNYNDLVKKAQIASEALKSKYGTKYTVGSSTNVLYAAAGGSDDWALGVAGVPYAYTLELRPDENSFSGFVLPPNQIKPTGEETWAGVKAFATAIM